MESDKIDLDKKIQPSCLGAVRRSSHRTICQQPLPEISCCYLLYGMGNKKWFEFYKGEHKIKEIFSASYFDALAEFMEWYKNYA
jgi:hypothetical protein